MTIVSVPFAFVYWWALARSMLGRLATKVIGRRGTPVEHPAQFQPPRDHVLVLDASPSMLEPDWPPSRLQAAQQSAAAFCRRLARDEPEARIALVAYGGFAEILCPLTPARHLDKLLRHINRIQVVDATNIGDGTQKAAEALARARGTSQVVLLSDGHNNTGPDPRPIAHRLKRSAVIECIGIGGSPSDVDEELMKDIASAYPDGTKRYRWIGDPERLEEAFIELAVGITRK